MIVHEVAHRSVMISYYRHVLGFYASLINGIAYHQLSVEVGKKEAREVLALHKRVFLSLNEASCKETLKNLALAQILECYHVVE